jgi:hypothetical protein
MSGFNLIKFEGKSLEKLIEVISNGIGTYYRPKSMRKEADSKAYAIETIERAKSKAIAEGKEIEAETYLRIQERTLFKELERQKSIDNVVEIAANQLKDEDNITEEPVNKDWSKRFFNIVQDISDEDMQTIWGRILAGETKTPNSYSLRTLEFLKNLSKNEAEIFTKFAKIKLNSGKDYFICNEDSKFLESEFNIKFTDKLLMVELGLILSKDSLEYGFNATQQSSITNAIHCGNKAIILRRKPNMPKQSISILVFTKIGIDIAKLITPSFNLKYFELICSKFKHQEITIEYGDFINLPNGGYKLLNNVQYQK